MEGQTWDQHRSGLNRTSFPVSFSYFVTHTRVSSLLSPSTFPRGLRDSITKNDLAAPSGDTWFQTARTPRPPSSRHVEPVLLQNAGSEVLTRAVDLRFGSDTLVRISMAISDQQVAPCRSSRLGASWKSTTNSGVPVQTGWKRGRVQIPGTMCSCFANGPPEREANRGRHVSLSRQNSFHLLIKTVVGW